MKKKLLALIIAATAISACAVGVGLVGCKSDGDNSYAGKENTCVHDYHYNELNIEKHIGKCNKCNDEIEEDHSFNANNICIKCGFPQQEDINFKTVSFLLDYETDKSINAIRYEVGKLMVGLPVPTRTGYNFIGWKDLAGKWYSAETTMPNQELMLIATWEKIISNYTDEFVTFKPATEGVKDLWIQEINEKDVDKFAYVELTSDDLGGIKNIGKENNFNLRTIEGMEYKLKEGYTWAWFQGDFNTPNGAQRFTLNYGSNIQFITVSDSSGIVQQTYLLDIYVKHDYYISLYNNIFEATPYDTIRVIENEKFSAETATAKEDNLEFDKRVFFNEDTQKFEPFAYSTAITKDWDLYQTYKPLTVNAELNGGTLEGDLQITPYTQNFSLPVPEKEGYDFLGWQNENGQYITNTYGFSGIKYIASQINDKPSFFAVPEILNAVFEEKRVYYVFQNDTLTTKKTELVVTYTDDFMTDILEIVYTLNNAEGNPIEVDENHLAKVGQEVSVEFSKLGNVFVGLYNGETKICENASYRFIAKYENVAYTAKWQIDERLNLFEYKLTDTTCAIKGIKDKTVTEIILPDYVTSISEGAFSGCSELINITISFDKLQNEDGRYVFGYIFGADNYSGGVATKQTNIDNKYVTYYLPASLKGVTVIGEVVPGLVFNRCDRLTSITITDSVTSIGGSAFENCSGLTSISIPDSVTSIGYSAFENCSGLTSITIPDSVTYIGYNVFYGCDGIIQIDNGISYVGKWVSYCESSITEVILRNDTKGIVGYAFEGRSGLTSITIPDGVTCIGHGAFGGCSGLTSITIPDSVTSICYYAFARCSGLTDIYYNGTEEQWKAIEKADSWDNKMGKYTVHFTG